MVGQVVLSCKSFDKTLEFFTGALAFRILSIYPADSPSVAELHGYDLHIRLVDDGYDSVAHLRLVNENTDSLQRNAGIVVAPNGTRVEFVQEEGGLQLPPLKPAFVFTQPNKENSWISGRAGMQYRDLIPSRLGGRFIASHIRIPEGGPVPDYVHFHDIHFQMIYCYRGWVKVVYEDQGPPFVMQAGDCVLQPPKIRHRVLESSKGLEVIEIGCPAEHITRVDHGMELPTPTLLPDQAFSGQHFVRHQASQSQWGPWRMDGFVARDTGICVATHGIAGAKVARFDGGDLHRIYSHSGEFMFWFILSGECKLTCQDQPDCHLQSGDSVVIPEALHYHIKGCSAELEILEVTLPGCV